MLFRTSTLVRVGIAVLIVMGVASQVHAESQLTAVPVVVDEKASARDILKETLSLTNNTDHKLLLYPSVNNVDKVDGEQAFRVATDSAQRADSLANWIELSRGVIDISPGETKQIPYIIRVNLNAIPGTYHAQLSFSDGSTRDEAAAGGALAVVTVNVEVKTDAKELLQLNKFYTDSIFFAGDDVLFNYQIQNIGNQDLQPTGEIRIYDRKGQEVASVDVNKDGKVVSPDQAAQLASVWGGARGFGKYKALLTVDYGKGQVASVQDTVFFWIIPWQQLLALFVGSLITVIFFALYFHRMFEQRHTGRVALAEISQHMPHAHEALHAPQISIPNAQAPAPDLDRPSLFGRMLNASGATVSSASTALASLPGSVATALSQRAARHPVAPRPVQAPVMEAPAVIHPPVVAVPPEVPRPVPVVATVVAPSAPAPETGSTINLKSIRAHAAQPEYNDSHVISLKKRS